MCRCLRLLRSGPVDVGRLSTVPLLVSLYSLRVSGRLARDRGVVQLGPARRPVRRSSGVDGRRRARTRHRRHHADLHHRHPRRVRLVG